MADIAEQMLAEALAAQKFTRKFFVVELDFTEASLTELERQFDAAKYALKGGLNAENIAKLTSMWGSYLGEVLRRHSAGQWTVIREGDADKPAIQTAAITVFPHDQIRARLEKGATENIVQYYQCTKASLT